MSVESESPALLEYLIDLLKFRLNDVGTSSLYTTDQYRKALRLAITAFNNRVFSTYFSLANEEFCKYFADVLIMYAVGVLLLVKSTSTVNYSFGGYDINWNPNCNTTTYTVTNENIRHSEYERDRWENIVREIKSSDTFCSEWVKDPE